MSFGSPLPPPQPPPGPRGAHWLRAPRAPAECSGRLLVDRALLPNMVGQRARRMRHTPSRADPGRPGLPARRVRPATAELHGLSGRCADDRPGLRRLRFNGSPRHRSLARPRCAQPGAAVSSGAAGELPRRSHHVRQPRPPGRGAHLSASDCGRQPPAGDHAPPRARGSATGSTMLCRP